MVENGQVQIISAWTKGRLMKTVGPASDSERKLYSASGGLILTRYAAYPCVSALS